MKNHIIISLLFLSVGLSQQEYNSSDLIEMDNGLWIERISDEPVTGKVYGYIGEINPYKKVYLGNLLNGKKVGSWSPFFRSTVGQDSVSKRGYQISTDKNICPGFPIKLYNSYNRLTEEIICLFLGSIVKYKYDLKNNIIEEYMYDSNGYLIDGEFETFPCKTIYKYDSNWNLVERTQYNLHDIPTDGDNLYYSPYKIINKYNKNNLLVETLELNVNGTLLDWTWKYRDKKEIPSKILYIYDLNDSLITQKSFNHKGELFEVKNFIESKN